MTRNPSRRPVDLSDEALLDRARALDAEALAAIHGRFYEPIFRYLAFRVPDRETAEDLTSEVFVRLVEALHAGQAPTQSLRGWLFTVAFRIAQDHYRRHYRAPQLPMDDDLEAPADDLDQALDDDRFRSDLAQAMSQLTDEQQSVLAMRFGAGLPIQHVADILGKSEGAVKQLQARAVATLGRHLAERR